MHSSYLQLGRLHFPVFGVFAALGVMAALALSQRTARYATLSPEAVWNAGVTAILSAFVVSRLLLVAFNFQSFSQYPLLVLALPSLTASGIVITALFMSVYVRWRKLPLLPLLDAEAPCVALLWAFLSIGRRIEGARDGMPTTVPWGVHQAGSVAVHPVEIYTLVVALLICLLLLRALRTSRSAGKVSAIGLVSSGFASFFVDFFRLPSDLIEGALLDPSQIIGIAMILVGAALFMRARRQITRESGNEAPDAI